MTSHFLPTAYRRARPLAPPFHPHRPDATELLSRRQRIAVAAGVGLAHALVFWLLMQGQGQGRQPPSGGETTTLVFLQLAPTDVPVPVDAASSASRRRSRTDKPEPASKAGEAVQAAPAQDPPARSSDVEANPGVPREDTQAATLDIYDADGSLALTDDVVARLEAVDTGSLSFGFEQPGLLENGAFMRRPVAIEYRPTQFDQHWIPERDILTSLLEKAVGAMSDEMEVPLAGGAKLLCKISLLAMGGGCQVASGRKPVSLDDPTTLNPEEDAQCAAWWERIASPASQAAWKSTYALYDFHCRKPLEKNLDPPEPAAAGVAA